MADENYVGAPEDESNVDQINQIITNSKDKESNAEENPDDIAEDVDKSFKDDMQEVAPKPKAKEKPIVTDVKIENSQKTEKKSEKTEHKKPHHVNHIQSKQIQSKDIMQEKKQEVKKEEKPEHFDKKPVNKQENHVKHEFKKEIKQEKVETKVEYKKEDHAKHEIRKEEKPRPVIKSEPKKAVSEKKEARKAIITQRPIKEEKMKNNKEHQKKSASNKNIYMWIGIGVLAIILVIALIFIFSPKKTELPLTNLTSNSVAATVNGDPIYLQDVKKEYDALDPTLKPVYTIEVILNKSIDDLLLYQEAKNDDIQVSPAEVQAELDNVKSQNQLTDSALEDALKQQGLTLEGVKTILEKNLMIRKLLNATVLNNITVSEQQIETYYNQNIDKFKVPDQVTVQHILILITPNVTNETAYAKILQVQKELNSTNFCDLVKKYSEDPGSLDTCGTYTFPRGQMVPEFENPSFDLNINETAIVKTVYGYHLIKKLDTIPARTMNLSEVRDQVETAVHDQIAQARFDAMLVTLRAKASIINYMTKTDSNETVIQPITPVKNLDDFAKCLTTDGAVFYGASWCTHCQNQKTLFGDSLQYVKYVECAGPGNTQTKECTDAGISGYPTWIVNNQSYPGEQTLENLAKLTGCTLPQ